LPTSGSAVGSRLWRVVADLLQAVGIAHVVTVDLRTPQIEGFFMPSRQPDDGAADASLRELH
jgi:phosphoribosylpyrophosphate synthetase